MTREESGSICLSKRATKDNSNSGPSEQPTTSSDAIKTDEVSIGAILSRDKVERMDTESVSSNQPVNI